jgi:hypothetical protein
MKRHIEATKIFNKKYTAKQLNLVLDVLLKLQCEYLTDSIEYAKISDTWKTLYIRTLIRE